MKNLVKVVNIHDGNELEHFNAERLYIESHPRAERIIAAFFDDGWRMADCIRRYNPAVAGRDPLTFFLGGWELIFVKTVDDDQEDNGDEIITVALSNHGYSYDDCFLTDSISDSF